MELSGYDPLPEDAETISPRLYRNEELTRLIEERDRPANADGDKAGADDGEAEKREVDEAEEADKGKRLKVLQYNVEARTSRAGHEMLVITAVVAGGRRVSRWLDFDGTSGYRSNKRKAQAFWEYFAKGDEAAPESIDEAVKRLKELRLPAYLTVEVNAQGFLEAQEFVQAADMWHRPGGRSEN